MNAYYAQDRIEAQRDFAHQAAIQREQWIDDRAQEIIDLMPKEPSGMVLFSVKTGSLPHEGLRSDTASEAYNDFISAVA